MMKGGRFSRGLSCLTAAFCLSGCPSPGPIIDPPPNPTPLPLPGGNTSENCATVVAPIFGQTPSASITLDPGSIRPTLADLAPPDERDVRSMALLLESMADPKRAPVAFAELVQGRPFTIPRFSVVLQDVRSVLIGMHARESLDNLGNVPGIPGDLRAWMESRLQVMILCPPTRFAERGGIDAYESTLSMVRLHRQNLEPFLFQAPQDPGGRRPRPAPPEIEITTNGESQ